MKIAICDSDAYYIDLLKNIINTGNKSYMDIRITVFGRPEELAVAHEKKGARFDIVFLDIKDESVNGIEAARRIRNVDSSVLIILTSQSMDFVFEGYEVDAFRYIMKPYTEEKISREYNKAFRQLFAGEKRYTIHTKSNIITCNIDDILYLESIKRQVCAVTTNGRMYFYSKLSIEEEKLKQYGFVRVHQGFLVHMGHIRTIVENNIYLTDNTIIPISKSRKKEALACYTKYLIDYNGI
ncbi:MAG: Transcriptional regulatory protein YpdB [Firmicutes bacterium ADurb.Bin193]|nr:MAG: Transcriptional regulatory protein YpdB [Firmicutes bacterium ADurb.Bin193]